MKKIINKISLVIQLLLQAPIKLPNKALALLKYVALTLGIVDKVTNTDVDKKDKDEDTR